MGKNKTKYSKTIACLAIVYLLKNKIGDGSSDYIKNILGLESRYVLYKYIQEINFFFCESRLIFGYDINLEIKYDHVEKKYMLVEI